MRSLPLLVKMSSVEDCQRLHGLPSAVAVSARPVARLVDDASPPPPHHRCGEHWIAKGAIAPFNPLGLCCHAAATKVRLPRRGCGVVVSLCRRGETRKLAGTAHLGGGPFDNWATPSENCSQFRRPPREKVLRLPMRVHVGPSRWRRRQRNSSGDDGV
jgi:hypothetical protein